MYLLLLPIRQRADFSPLQIEIESVTDISWVAPVVPSAVDNTNIATIMLPAEKDQLLPY